jgi:hypothetical protein
MTKKQRKSEMVCRGRQLLGGGGGVGCRRRRCAAREGIVGASAN